MSYGRIVTPRIYTCTMRSMLARESASTVWSLIAGALNTGSDINDLLNPRPGQRCSFDTSTYPGTTNIILQFDMGISTSNPINFLAIVGHNMATAECAEPTLRHNTVGFTGPGEGTAVTPLTYPWGGVAGGVVSENGVTGFTFAEVTNKRYWAVEIPDDNTFSGNDLQIGAILIGAYYDFPFSPDLEVSAPHEFGGVKVVESGGGQGWATALHLGGTSDSGTTFGQPFRVVGTDYRRRRLAKRAWDVNFSRIEDTNLRPQYADQGLTACANIEDVWERTCGPLLPFIWQPDGSAGGSDGDCAWARFDQDTLAPKQGPSPKVWSYKLSIREDF